MTRRPSPRCRLIVCSEIEKIIYILFIVEKLSRLETGLFFVVLNFEALGKTPLKIVFAKSITLGHQKNVTIPGEIH